MISRFTVAEIIARLFVYKGYYEVGKCLKDVKYDEKSCSVSLRIGNKRFLVNVVEA